MIGKTLKFSGELAVSSSDTTQEAIGIAITSYRADDSVIDEVSAVEKEKALTPREVALDITDEVDHVTVTVTIWKQGTRNVFNFADLRLEARTAETGFERER